MNKMSLEELIGSFAVNIKHGRTDWTSKIEKEIHFRFAELTEKVRELENQVVLDNSLLGIIDNFIIDNEEPADFWMSSRIVYDVVTKIAELKQQIKILELKNKGE